MLSLNSFVHCEKYHYYYSCLVGSQGPNGVTRKKTPQWPLFSNYLYICQYSHLANYFNSTLRQCSAVPCLCARCHCTVCRMRTSVPSIRLKTFKLLTYCPSTVNPKLRRMQQTQAMVWWTCSRRFTPTEMTRWREPSTKPGQSPKRRKFVEEEEGKETWWTSDLHSLACPQ